MRFTYSGVTRQRENVRGSIEAIDEVEARMRLRAMQIRPTALSTEAAGASLTEVLGKLGGGKGLKGISLSPPINLKGMVVFTRQFSSLVDSGVPIVQCLDILAQQEKRAPFKKILVRVKEDIEAGAGLAEALAKHPNAFNEFFIRVLEAGEVSGTLDKALRRAGLQLEKLGRLRAKVISAMLYPCITLVVAIFVLIFLLVKVIPEVAKLYSDSSASLPELTSMVLKLSRFVQAEYLYLVGGLVGMIVGGIAIYRTESFRKVWDPIWIRLPLFGQLTRKSTIARFTRTLSTLLSSGVPLLNAFDICLKLIGNRAIYDAVKRGVTYVAEGKSIAQGLAYKDIFPVMVIHMINIGELTGRLDEMLGKVADIYDDEVDDVVTAMTTLLQPMMIVIVGGIIFFLILAMYLPLFQLAEKVSGA